MELIKRNTINNMKNRKDIERMSIAMQKVKNPPPKPVVESGYLDTLKKGASLWSGYDAIASAAKTGTDFVKNQIAGNLNPRGYGHGKNGTVERVVKSMYKPERGSANSQGNQPNPAMAERQDLLSLMMTGKQRRDKMPVSEYSPEGNPFFKNVKEGTTYYRSPETERYIKENFKKGWEWKDFDKSMDKDGKFLMRGSGGGVLGKYTMYKGKDEKGEYIDYYDKWDLNPFEKYNKGKGSLLDKAATKAQEIASVKPAEVYGRVYYDNIK